MKLYVYPQHKINQTKNPYVNNMEQSFSDYFDIVHKEYRLHLPQPLRLLLSSTKANIYVCNWIECTAEGEGGALLRGLTTLVAICVILLRRAKIVWIFHNIHPHDGETRWSLFLKKILFRYSSLIVSHSKEAADYAMQFANCPVKYKSHPIKNLQYRDWNGGVKECDFYIWGHIFPYKGVKELVSNPLCVTSRRKILIVGKCDEPELNSAIVKYCNENVVFENRSANFDEIAAQCRKAKYVLFPYIGESVSSSGVLMDTLLMGGTPVGPDKGAFKDLKERGCCVTYKSYSELFNLPIQEGQKICLEPNNVHSFLKENTWSGFAKWLFDEVS